MREGRTAAVDRARSVGSGWLDTDMTNPPHPNQPDPKPDSQQALGQETNSWTSANPMPGYGPGPSAQPGPPPMMYGEPGYPPPPVRPPLLSRTPTPVLMAVGSTAAGLVTFFMGFLGWVTVSDEIDHKAEVWATGMNGTFDVPAYLSPSLILSPGWFFLLLGTVGVAAAGLAAPRWRRYLPLLAFLAIFGWLGLLVCALGLPPFLSLGAGAYVALTVGFIQAALLAIAAVIDGRAPADQGPPPRF
ncbi:hypothetical protein UG54_10895 [Gordonia sihwensis]|nr:hypothetical protein UG54_10895 [Gordonia sihwensis]